jgi:proteasome assembly chaperone (PAC2) family protein
VEIMSGEIQQILGDINTKLEKLLTLKHDLDELNMRTKNMEEILSEYLLVLSKEEKVDLDKAMKEYAAGKTTPLEDAERILEL